MKNLTIKRNKFKVFKKKFIDLRVKKDDNKYLIHTRINYSEKFIGNGVDYSHIPNGRKPLKLEVKIKTQITTGYKYYKNNWRYKTDEFTIPAGYIWDGASIPKIFRFIIGDKLAKEFALASMLHDFAIEKKLLPTFIESQLFYRCLQAQKGCYNIPSWKEKTMYAAVYGWSIFTDVKNLFKIF